VASWGPVAANSEAPMPCFGQQLPQPFHGRRPKLPLPGALPGKAWMEQDVRKRPRGCFLRCCHCSRALGSAVG